MELVMEGVFNAISGGLKTFFGQLVELLFLACVVMSGEDGVFAAGAVLAGEVRGMRFVLRIGAEMVFVVSGAKGVGASVKGGEGDRTTVRAEELEEGVGLLMIGGELAEDLILMGAKLS
jgi:hypothetical protein